MARSSLEATPRRSATGAVSIELSGEIDGSARDALERAYEQSGGDGPLLLEFAAVDYINSTGIAVIVSLLARARADRRSVSASGLSPHYREIFEITRLSDFMTILADDASPREPDNGALT